LHRQAFEESEPQHHLPPFLLDAQAVLRHGGVEALRGLLLEREDRSAPLIYAVDESGRDILGREPPVGWERPMLDGSGLEPVVANDGHAYRLFVAHGEDRPPPMPPLGDAGPSPSPPPGEPPGHRPRRVPAPSPIVLVLIGLLASLLFSAWLAWYLSRPIRNLRAAFEALAEGKLDTRIGQLMGRRRDELADLGGDFDRMAGRIGNLMDAQRRLLHDVSHELRSPLARLQAAVGLAKQRPDKISTTLERVERESERLDRLVSELLALSRLEAGVPGSLEDEIEIDGLLAEIVEDARFEAKAKDVRVECDLAEDLIILGGAELIHRAIENVVRNAVQHAPCGSLVQVEGRLEPNHRQFCLRVCDQGPGVDEAQLSAIFQPFFRGANRQGGTGLGLAIARRALEAHGGRIAAHNRAEGGLCVELSLPIDAGAVA
jgi:two-component system OmpR family sensor kinase